MKKTFLRFWGCYVVLKLTIFLNLFILNLITLKALLTSCFSLAIVTYGICLVKLITDKEREKE